VEVERRDQGVEGAKVSIFGVSSRDEVDRNKRTGGDGKGRR
jgi:hypothetical protein